jgi:hypothetical protein
VAARKNVDSAREWAIISIVSYRLAYGSLILLLLAIFALLLSLKMVPYWQTKYRFEAIPIDGHSVAIAWAVDHGPKHDEVAGIPTTVSDNFHFAFPWLNAQRQVEDYALKILVKARLPESSTYVMKLTGQDDTITLPLKRQSDGTYASDEFIALEDTAPPRYFHGVRVFRVSGEQCLLAVERVVAL